MANRQASPPVESQSIAANKVSNGETLFPEHPGRKPQNLSPVLIIVMGVSGCGKSTVGRRLADTLRMQFVDGDDLHPKSNIDKMSRGEPLNDQDRAPWLNIIRQEASRKTTPEALNAFYDGQGQKDPVQPRAGIVIACSALKKSYRDMLRGSAGSPEMRSPDRDLQTYFVYLKGSREVLLNRMQQRKGHFFVATMLDSQLESLEEPSSEEQTTGGVMEVNIDAPETQVSEKVARQVAETVGLNLFEVL